jgi:hypothetical protein
MTLQVPKPVAAYFTADAQGAEALVQCFTENAVVKDDGHTYRGKAAIGKWKEDVAAKYQYTCEPFACEQVNGNCVVTSKLTGNFPGSPLNLRFSFGLEGDKIAALDIGL